MARAVLQERMRELKLETITFVPIRLSGTSEKTVKVSLPKFKCSQDECRGFVGEDYSCGICSTMYCDKCRCILHEGRCDKDMVKSVMAIVSETRPCPKCYTAIFKVSGCDQMFCTSCNTSFSWTTGEIETTLFHNPHYYEWLAQNANGAEMNTAQRENLACGEIPDPYAFTRLVQHLELARYHVAMHRELIHIREVVLPEFADNKVHDNFDLRVCYMLNKFDEQTWALKLMNREKKRMKVRAYRELMETSLVIVTDLLRQMLYDPHPAHSYAMTLKYGQFYRFLNEEAINIADPHGGKVPGVISNMVHLSYY